MSPAARGQGGARAVHQFVPALIPRDATGTHTLLARAALRRAGWRSEIFAEATHDELAAESHKVTDYPAMARPGDVLVYQFSTSSMVADFLATRPEPLILDYHNVTGSEHYERWDPESARRSAEARHQLQALAPRAALGIADSAYNEGDLRAAGCAATAVVPVLAAYGRLAAAPDPVTAGRLAAGRAGGGAQWLFVGRLVPSKAQHQLVKALWAYRRLYDGRARLHLVGAAPARRYLVALRDFAAELGLGTAVRIAGEVSDAALAAYFAAADAYVSLSVHEGFGVPLVEAMAAGVPVVATAAGALPEVLGDGALLVPVGDAGALAAALGTLLGSDEARRTWAGRGRARAAGFSWARCAEGLAALYRDAAGAGR